VIVLKYLVITNYDQSAKIKQNKTDNVQEENKAVNKKSRESNSHAVSSCQISM